MPLDRLQAAQLSQRDNRGGLPTQADHLVRQLTVCLRTRRVAIWLGPHRGHRSGGQ